MRTVYFTEQETDIGDTEARVLHIDVEERSEELLRQISYAIKN